MLIMIPFNKQMLGQTQQSQATTCGVGSRHLER